MVSAENQERAPRLSLVDLEHASEPIREYTKNLPPLHLFRTLAHAESAFGPLMQLALALNQGTELSRKHSELTMLHAANQEGGEYEWVQHVPISIEAGTSPEQHEALRQRNYDPAIWDEAECALLNYLQQAVEQSKVDSDVWNELRKHFSEREFTEITITHGLYRTMSILTENAETPIDRARASETLELMKGA